MHGVHPGRGVEQPWRQPWPRGLDPGRRRHRPAPQTAPAPLRANAGPRGATAPCSERAHALAAMLLPFVRPCVQGPTPLHVIEGPVYGTGKSLLAKAISRVVARKERVLTVDGDDAAEARTEITPEPCGLRRPRPLLQGFPASGACGVSWKAPQAYCRGRTCFPAPRSPRLRPPDREAAVPPHGRGGAAGVGAHDSEGTRAASGNGSATGGSGNAGLRHNGSGGDAGGDSA